MLKTKLILIEGLPGAGKSTTAEYLATILQQRGIACRWFHEFDYDNPITDLDVRLDQYPLRMVEEGASWSTTPRMTRPLPFWKAGCGRIVRC